MTNLFLLAFLHATILGDPGADSGGERKSKQAEKYGTKKRKERREKLFSPCFSLLSEKTRKMGGIGRDLITTSTTGGPSVI